MAFKIIWNIKKPKSGGDTHTNIYVNNIFWGERTKKCLRKR